MADRPDLGEDRFLPDRMAALGFLLEGERKLAEEFVRILDEWFHELRGSVLSGLGTRWATVDPLAVQASTPTWARLLADWLEAAVAWVVGRAYERVMGEGYAFTNRPWVAQHLREVENRLVRMPDEVFNLMRRELDAGINDGESIPELAARIDEELLRAGAERWTNRATTIARTECLPGWMVVDSANMTAAYERWYEGDLHSFRTASGREFTATPNHPVLTARGWVALKEVTEGDRVICHRACVQEPGATGDEHVQAGPPAISEVFHATQAVVVPHRMATAEPDFHGDGREGYVNVLRPNSPLRLGAFPPIQERLNDLLLAPTELHAVALAALRAPFRRDVAPDQLSRLSRGPGGHSGRLNDPPNDAWVNTELPGEREGGDAAPVSLGDLVVLELLKSSWVVAGAVQRMARIAQVPTDPRLHDCSADHVTGEARRLRDLPFTEAGHVETDDVVAVGVIKDWAGHVYNLTTTDGYYVSNGVYTGNTVSAYNGATEDAFEVFEDAFGIELEKVWLASMDHRTRDTHFAADGQRVPKAGAFVVGGFPGQYPGDPLLPAKERINCLTADSRINAGRFVKGYRRWYEGEVFLVELDSGERFTASPNHPVLTPEGWRGAGDLKVGDHLIGGALTDDRLAGSPDVEGEPPTAAQLYDALADVGHATRLPGLPVDFHGDGVDGEVEVVLADRELVVGLDTPLGQHRYEALLASPDLARLAARTVQQPRVRPTPPTHGGMGGGHLAGAGLPFEVGPLDPFGFASPSDRNAYFAQAAQDRRTADSEPLGQGLDGHAIQVELHKVVHVERQSFHGFLYNFETTSGSYIGNSVINHNCRCTVLYVEPGEETDMSGRGYRDDKDIQREIRSRAERGIIRWRDE